MDEKKERARGKLNAELKQTPKGEWYISSLNIDSDSIEEFDSLVLQASKRLTDHIKQLNMQQVKQEVKQEVKQDVYTSPQDLKLFQNLKELRKLIAKKEGYPPYVVFHDSALRKLVREKPKTKDELITAIGQKKFDKYGALIVEVLDKHRLVF